MELKEFQVETIRKSVNNIYELLEIAGHRAEKGDTEPAHFVLQSCTGSGKTVMLAEILRELKERDLSEHYVYVWAAPNKLHSQSQKKLSNILADTEYKLIDIELLEEIKANKRKNIFEEDFDLKTSTKYNSFRVKAISFIKSLRHNPNYNYWIRKDK